MKKQPLSDERRSHYRIDDDIYLRYCVIPKGQVWDDEALFQALFDEQRVKHYQISQQFRELDQTVEDAMSTLQQQDPAVHACFKMLNRKLAIFNKALFLSEPGSKTHANVSIGGVRFVTDEPIEPGGQLKLNMLLKPNDDVVICSGQVLRCETLDPCAYQISVEFTELDSQQEKYLSRHIMVTQTQKLKKN